ncbi:MAG: LPS O-antigen length regulator [Marinobacter sp.]|nr:LPS O-antigen length regulator [Marinobacter sp.]
MNQTQEHPHYPDDEIDLRELFATLWRGKWIILLFTAIFAAGGVAYALSQPNVYTASALLAPASDDNGGRVGGQLAGLAGLAGINLGGGGSNRTVIAREVLQSRAFLSDFIRRHNLEVPLMATSGWDIVREEWIIDTDIYSPETEQWGVDSKGKSREPTDWDLVKTFRDQLRVSESRDTGMVTVSITSLSPLAAQQWITKLVRDLNEHMREQEVSEAEASIQYLEGKLQEVNIAGMQQVFYQLIESETRTIMLASAQREYVFRTIDPAVVPQEKSWPNRALICVVATMLGGMLGVFVVFVTALVRSGKAESTEIVSKA